MKRAKALVLGFFESRNYSQAYESCGTKWIELATVDADVHHRIAKGGMPKNQEVDFSKRLYEVSANFGHVVQERSADRLRQVNLFTAWALATSASAFMIVCGSWAFILSVR